MSARVTGMGQPVSGQPVRARQDGVRPLATHFNELQHVDIAAPVRVHDPRCVPFPRVWPLLGHQPCVHRPARHRSIHTQQRINHAVFEDTSGCSILSSIVDPVIMAMGNLTSLLLAAALLMASAHAGESSAVLCSALAQRVKVRAWLSRKGHGCRVWGGMWRMA